MNKYRVEVKLGNQKIVQEYNGTSELCKGLGIKRSWVSHNIGSFNDSIKFNKYTKIKVIERKGIYYARDKTNA